MVRILLTSDIHLGAEIEQSPVPDNLRLKTFKKLTNLARSHDLFLIAGDLFHKSGINEKIMDSVNEEFNSLIENGVEIVYVLGEQELSEKENMSYLTSLRISKLFSDNNIVAPYKFSKDDQTIFIYGISAYNEINISEINKISDMGFHIGLFHTDFYFHEDMKAIAHKLDNEEIAPPPLAGEFYEQALDNVSQVSRIDKRDIIASNLDFYALGHHHQFKLFKSNARYIGAYPGSPEAVAFDESGDRYALSIVIKDDEIYQIKRLTVNSSKLEHIYFDCSKTDPMSIIQLIKENESGDKIFRIVLTGKRNFTLDIDEINNAGREFRRFFIEDKSSPSVDVFINEFAGEESIRGEFFNILNEKMRNNECPDIDMDILSEILHKVIYSGAFTLEDLCTY